MAVLDRIASVFFDDPDDQAAAIIHAVSVEMGTVGFFSSTRQSPSSRFSVSGISDIGRTSDRR